MNLLFGAFGPEMSLIREEFKKTSKPITVSNHDYFISNQMESPIDYPQCVAANGKSLFLNGVFIFRNITLDNFLKDPHVHLQRLLEKDSAKIPGEFVNGAFNGVVINGDALWLFNDFMAMAPLYYTFEKDTFIFSTTLQMLQRILNRPWNAEAVSEYVALGYNFSYQTLLKGIDCLPPASLLCLKNDKLTLTNYATFPNDLEMKAGKKKVIENVHHEFVKAIGRIYSPKLKYSLSLTGGMDSRLIYFEWPNRNELFTETAGENSSDFLKARELAEKLGDPSLHTLEDLKDDQYTNGIDKFYQACDNPTKLLADYNYHHLIWKKNRGADFHLSGAGGELLNGESLYLSRKPSSVLREAFLPYVYIELKNSAKKTLIENVLYSKYKSSISELLDEDYSGKTNDYSARIADRLDSFLGKPRYKQTYTERFRTFLQANASFYPLNVVSNDSDFLILPYNDRDLIETITRYHPCTRELRRLELALLKKYDLAADIPLDSSHLMQNRPYFAHKFMRTVRMVLNIGLHKKVPFFQKGEPPKFRAFKYFDHSAVDFRDHIKKTILQASFFDKKKIENYLSEIENVEKFSFYTHHREEGNLMILFRLAMLEKNLKNVPQDVI
jgi:hypothetical protein